MHVCGMDQHYSGADLVSVSRSCCMYIYQLVIKMMLHGHAWPYP